MQSYADFVKDRFCLTRLWCIFMSERVFGLFLRYFMLLVEKLVDLSTSKFVSVSPDKVKCSLPSMDVIDIPSSDSETEKEYSIPASRTLPASISGFVGKSQKEPLLTTYSFSSHPNGRDSHQKINRQDEPDFSAMARTVDKSHAISPHDVDNAYSAASGKTLRVCDPHSSMQLQQHESQPGNGFYTEKTNGTISSDKTTEYRHLPKTLMNTTPVIEIPDSDFQKNTQQMNGRDRLNEGSITSSHLNGEHQRAHTGYNSEFGFCSVDTDRGKTINHRSHFQLYGDPPVPKYEIQRSLPKSFEPGKPVTEYETSTVVDGGASSGGSNTGHRTFYMVNGVLGMENEDDEEISIYKVPRQRVLPASFTGSGKSVGNPYPAGFSGMTRFTGAETPIENDETPIYQAALQDLSLPRMEVDVPDGVLAVQLLRHQKIALAWMAQKETIGPNCLGGILADDQGLGKTVSTIALIKIQGPRQHETAFSDTHRMKFEPLNLDDDDDNVSVLDKVNEVVKSEKVEKESIFSSMAAAPRKGRPAAGTLVVCPASVLRQWARELDEKVAKGEKLKVLVYHGSTRTRDPSEIAKFDVVLTTYSIVSNEVPKLPQADEDDEEQKNMDTYAFSSGFSTNKKRKKASNDGKKRKKSKKGMDDSAVDSESGPLARVLWFRLVLDEAQSIKNHRTQVARACCGLRAKRRWCLSGTPIQNTIDDLYSYFRFLRYDPYATYKSFCATIKYPISKNSIHGYLKLQAVLKIVMLRRTKETKIDGTPVLQLPPKSVSLKKIIFSPAEHAFYSSLEADFRTQFKKYADEGTVNQNYANILLMLLRLRQACDHPLLAEGFHSNSVGTPSLKTARKLPKEMIYLLNLLEPSAAICRLCNDPPEDAVVTMCGHVFCYQCLSDMLAGDCNSCPVEDCKDQVSSDSTFSRAILRSSISGKLDNDNDGSCSGVEEKFVGSWDSRTSSKIKAALEILSAVCKPKKASSALISDASGQTELSTETTSYLQSSACFSELPLQLPDKVIVFSQWTSMLDLLEISLKESSIQFRRLDGTMTLASRDKAVKDFTTNPEVTVMIMSLKAGNLGLNMVAANHVIILDLWWNPTTEDQAVDRAHRIGQTRHVTVSRLTIENTVEDRILALQEKKREMVSSAFGEDQTGGSATRLTVEDLRFLFMGGSL